MTLAQPWPFAADWTNPILEGLEWLTAIQTSQTGAEQRQAIRVTPRRRIDMPFQLYGQERSYFDMLLAQFGGKQWHVPLPHEQVRFDGVFLAGTSNFVFDTSFREFRVGARAIVRGNTFLTEVVTITGVTSTGITVSALVKDYLTGLTVTPAFVGMITDKVAATRPTARVLMGTVRFYAVEPTIWPPAARANDYATYSGLAALGYPVLTQEPNAMNDLDYTYERMLQIVDTDTAIPTYSDTPNTMFASQKHEWFLYGRKEKSDFRDLMFFLRGRCGPLWVPTFNDDLAIGKGFPDPDDYVTTTVPDRQYMIYFYRNGAYATFLNTRNATLPPEDFDSDTIQRISFMSLKRLDVDTIEFSHEIDVDGVTTVSAIFRDAPDIRVANLFSPDPFGESGYVTSSGTTPATNPIVIDLTDGATVSAFAPYVPSGAVP